MDRKIFRLDDSFIAHLARVIQLGMLRGEDIVDHIRQVRLEESKGGVLKMTPEYIDHEKAIIDRMFDELNDRLATVGDAN